MIVALTILYIVFGAILMLNTLKESGAIHSIRQGFMDVSPDRRVQVIIVAWLSGSLVEGSLLSGFGTPSAVGAPLLLALGFAGHGFGDVDLIIRSTPVSIGAVGTPLLVGVWSGINNKEDVTAGHYAANRGAIFAANHRQRGLAACAGGLFDSADSVRHAHPLLRRKRSFREGLKAWKFAIFAGIAFTVPYYLVARFFRPRIPLDGGRLYRLDAGGARSQARLVCAERNL